MLYKKSEEEKSDGALSLYALIHWPYMLTLTNDQLHRETLRQEKEEREREIESATITNAFCPAAVSTLLAPFSFLL